MRQRWVTRVLSAIVSCLLVTPAVSQHSDVTFFVIGKHAKFEQRADGQVAPVDFSFFSEIFFTADGDATKAFMNMPTGERIRYRDQRLVEGAEKDNLLLIRGAKRYSSYAELQSWYPDGVYEIEFHTPSGPVDDGVLTFPQDGLPNAPTVTMHQDGQKRCSIVDPNRNLRVSWSKFAEGSADENGVLDDLIFVILEDEDGNRVSHSGRPFEDKPYLTYADSSHNISASAMLDGHEYNLSVEHAVLTDTKKFDSVPAMTTYAVTTNLKFRTHSNAAAAGADCSESAIEDAGMMRPTTDAQVVMFYYKDLTAADHFYGQVLGLQKTLDEDWVKFYATSPNATVGLVAEGDGAWHKVQDSSAVMLSIVTSEVDAWYDRLRKNDGIRILKDIGDGGPIRSFLIEDPGGYTVEFFEWQRSGGE